MSSNTLSDLILQETKQLPDALVKEVLDFVLFLKSKNDNSSSSMLSALRQSELVHLEDEFADYKTLYPNE